ncbi:hypothetical protein [Agrobacterium pusense]|uniref:hypothetical protein n=1 Tax=Agrobacterium TaxID=357 RepID=UPI0031F37807
MLRHRWMEEGRRLVRRCQEGVQFGLAQLELIAPLLHGFNRDGLLEIEVHQPLFLTTDLLDLRLRRMDVGAAFHAQAIGLLRVGVTELRENLGIKHPVA